MNKMLTIILISITGQVFANSAHTYNVVFQTPNAAVQKPTPKVAPPSVPDNPPPAAPIHKNDNPHDLNPNVGSYGTPTHNSDTTITTNPEDIQQANRPIN